VVVGKGQMLHEIAPSFGWQLSRGQRGQLLGVPSILLNEPLIQGWHEMDPSEEKVPVRLTSLRFEFT